MAPSACGQMWADKSLTQHIKHIYRTLCPALEYSRLHIDAPHAD
jgi:hypothetical protein